MDLQDQKPDNTMKCFVELFLLDAGGRKNVSIQQNAVAVGAFRGQRSWPANVSA
jgi:hypothetical protein